MSTIASLETQQKGGASLPQGREPAPQSAGVVRKPQVWITGLSLLVGFLALIATTAGIFTAFGAHHRSFVSIWGARIALQGGGLYARESVSGAAQAIGQDSVTLLVGIPLLGVATYLASHGSLRGQLLRAGMLWYFTYTYLLMAFGGTYNPLFLVYVALYSTSLFALILSLSAIDVKRLPGQVSPRFARRTIAWLVIGFGVMLALLWLSRIVPALISGAAPAGLESYSTLFVQAGDLGLVVPLAILTGALLLMRHATGYLLAGVLLVKGATFGLALIAMMIVMATAAVTITPVEVAFFTAVTVVFALGVIHLLTCLPTVHRLGARPLPTRL